jgi:AcrR family transcriptional regulator
MVTTRRRRTGGETSRRRILDAAAEVAGERGYEGTSISLVSERSGLPASSIYWHFNDKDDLIAAVIDRSFQSWIQAWDRQPLSHDGTTREEAFQAGTRQLGRELSGFPDFLRLGLMLVLEHRPEEPTARQRFIEVRRIVRDRLRSSFEHNFRELSADDVRALVALTLAMADGFFIASEADGAGLEEAFDAMATAILGAAARMSVKD